MLQGINILSFYYNFSETRWSNPNTDIKENCVVFKNEKIPPFIIYSDKVFTGITASIVNVDDSSINQEFTCSFGAAEYGNIIKFLSTGYMAPALPEGYYYIKLTLTPSGQNIYSEVFALKNNVTVNNLLRCAVQSANVTLSGKYNVPLSEIQSVEFYLFINGLTLSGEINEDGVEKPYGNIPIFSTLNIKHIVEVNCTNDIVRYLHALRILETNGTVYLVQANLLTLPEVYGIEISVKDEYNFGDHTIVELTFREKDYISTRNAI